MVENEDGFYTEPEPVPEPTPPPQISIVESQPQPQPQATLPQPLIDQIDKFLTNPLFAISAKKYIPEIRKYIKDNSGDYEPLVYDYLLSKYPGVYSILSSDNKSEDEDEYDDEDEDDTPRKPVPRAAINYEIMELAKEGYTPTEISDFLNEKYDRDDLLPMHIGRTIARQRKAAIAATKLKSIKQVTPTPNPTPTPTPTPILSTIPHKQDIKQPNIDSTSLVFIDTISSILWNKIKIYVFMGVTLAAGFIIGRLS